MNLSLMIMGMEPAEGPIPIDGIVTFLPNFSAGKVWNSSWIEYWEGLVKFTEDFLNKHMETPEVWWEYLLAFSCNYPWIAAVLICFVLGGVWVCRQFFVWIEPKRKKECPYCEAMMYRCALRCPSCGNSNPHPKSLNCFGYTTLLPFLHANNRKNHVNSMRSHARCVNCGEILKNARQELLCPSCNVLIWENDASVLEYDQYISKRLRWVWPCVLVISFVPMIGTLVASVVYKWSLVKPYAKYIPRGWHYFIFGVLRTCRYVLWISPVLVNGLMWGVGSLALPDIVNVVVSFAVSMVVALLSSFAMPILCLIEWYAYHRTFLLQKLQDKYVPIEQKLYDWLQQKMIRCHH